MEENRFSLCKVWSNILWCVLRCIGAPRGLNQFVLILPFYLLTGRAVKWVANSKHRHISPNHTTPNLITPQFTSPGHTSLVTLSYAPPPHLTAHTHTKRFAVKDSKDQGLPSWTSVFNVQGMPSWTLRYAVMDFKVCRHGL